MSDKEDIKAETKEQVAIDSTETSIPSDKEITNKSTVSETKSNTNAKEKLTDEKEDEKTQVESVADKLEDISLTDEPLKLNVADVPTAPKAVPQEAEDEIVPSLPPRGSPISPTKTVSFESPKPQHPLVNQLKEAFPQFEEKYIVAVLIASTGDLEAAYNACLYLVDPTNSEIEIPDKPLPVRNGPRSQNSRPCVSASSSSSANRPSSRNVASMSQIEADELLARQLSEEYHSPARSRHRVQQQQQQQQFGNPTTTRTATTSTERRRPLRDYSEEATGDDDVISNFMEKDFPVLKENVNKSIRETSTKVGNWFKSFSAPQPANSNNNQQPTFYNNSNNNNSGNGSKNVDEFYYENDGDDRLFLNDSRYSNTAEDPYKSTMNSNRHYGSNRGEKKRFNSFGNADSNANNNVHLNYNDSTGDAGEDEELYQPPPALPPRRSDSFSKDSAKTGEETTGIDTPFNDNKKFKTPAKLDQQYQSNSANATVETNEFDAADEEMDMSPSLKKPLLQLSEPVAMIGNHSSEDVSRDTPTKKQPASANVNRLGKGTKQSFVMPGGSSKNANEYTNNFIGGNDFASSSKSSSSTPVSIPAVSNPISLTDKTRIADEDDLDFSD